MEVKKQNVDNYIYKQVELLKEYGIDVTDEQINTLKTEFIDYDKEESEIYQVIDKVVEEMLRNFKRMLEEQEKYMQALTEVKEIQKLPLEYTGITLNKQDIDLMLLAKDDPSRFNEYMEELISRVEYYKNPNIELIEKLNRLQEDGVISDIERESIDEILKSSKSQSEIKEKLASTFEQEKLHEIYKGINGYEPIEKTGVKGTSIEAYQNLYNQVVNNYNSITIDEEAKYGHIVLGDGTFDFDNLRKCLDFAKATNSQVRLNTILFYMDCPEELYNLPQNEESKIIVKEKLSSYVDAITSFIKENGYESVVRSIDVFNELLNRFAKDGEKPYEYRGDIPQEESTDLDNIKSGWLKHLDIEDLCDVVAIARKNLPNTDFMYNDDNLVDQRKMPATMEIIRRIQAYELSHQVKLIDSIGNQMHISNAVTQQDVAAMLMNLSQIGLPIEITEFDMVMTEGIEGLNDEQIENIRQQKMNEIYDTMMAAKDICNLKGFTIWSKTDRQNFRVSLENKKRIRNGEEPITTLHGGMFTENMELKSKINSNNMSLESKVDDMVNEMENADEYKSPVKEETNQKVMVKNTNGFIKSFILGIMTILFGIGLLIFSILING